MKRERACVIMSASVCVRNLTVTVAGYVNLDLIHNFGFHWYTILANINFLWCSCSEIFGPLASAMFSTISPQGLIASSMSDPVPPPGAPISAASPPRLLSTPTATSLPQYADVSKTSSSSKKRGGGEVIMRNFQNHDNKCPFLQELATGGGGRANGNFQQLKNKQFFWKG